MTEKPGWVSATCLFNRLQSRGGLLMIDCRSKEAHALGHIAFAINLPEQSPEVTVEALVGGLDEAQATWFRRLCTNEIILYSHDTESTWVHRLAGLLGEGSPKKVGILAISYAEFQQRYPFLNCTEENFSDPTEMGLSYPNEIIEGLLFLGNFKDSQNPKVLSDLGITHVINASNVLVEYVKKEGVEYFEVPIPDDDQAKMHPFFADAVKFVTAAQRAGGRVLIHCKVGISRSATLTICTVMHLNKWHLRKAFRHVARCREIICPSQTFREQLLAGAELPRPMPSSTLSLFLTPLTLPSRGKAVVWQMQRGPRGAQLARAQHF
mmetsp:Transcript_7048/g.15628  ORF Transcript_7048/g.15628 Transcript_7048/m.15628 type:complete len:323 (-) Transcript_7048:35-1003(-)